MEYSYINLCVFNFGKHSYSVVKNKDKTIYFEVVDGKFVMPIVSFNLFDNEGKSLTIVNQHFFMNQLISRINLACRKGVFVNNNEIIEFLNKVKSRVEVDDYLKKLFKGSLMNNIDEENFENNKKRLLDYLDKFKFDNFIQYNNVSIFNGSLEKNNDVSSSDASINVDNNVQPNSVQDDNLFNDSLSEDVSENSNLDNSTNVDSEIDFSSENIFDIKVDDSKESTINSNDYFNSIKSDSGNQSNVSDNQISSINSGDYFNNLNNESDFISNNQVADEYSKSAVNGNSGNLAVQADQTLQVSNGYNDVFGVQGSVSDVQPVQSQAPQMSNGFDNNAFGVQGNVSDVKSVQSQVPQMNNSFDNNAFGVQGNVSDIQPVQSQVPQMNSGFDNNTFGVQSNVSDIQPVQSQAPQMNNGFDNNAFGVQGNVSDIQPVQSQAPQMNNGYDNNAFGVQGNVSDVQSVQSQAPQMSNGFDNNAFGVQGNVSDVQSVQSQAPQMNNGYDNNAVSSDSSYLEQVKNRIENRNLSVSNNDNFDTELAVMSTAPDEINLEKTFIGDKVSLPELDSISDENDSTQKKSSKGIVIFIIILVLLLIGATFFLYNYVF